MIRCLNYNLICHKIRTHW